MTSLLLPRGVTAFGAARGVVGRDDACAFATDVCAGGGALATALAALAAVAGAVLDDGVCAGLLLLAAAGVCVFAFACGSLGALFRGTDALLGAPLTTSDRFGLELPFVFADAGSVVVLDAAAVDCIVAL